MVFLTLVVNEFFTTVPGKRDFSGSSQTKQILSGTDCGILSRYFLPDAFFPLELA